MSGEFDVVTSELTRAAGRIRSAVAPAACFTLSSEGASAAAYGHNELAEVVATFCSKASEVISAAASGDERAAGQLDASARSYDVTDSATGTVFGGLSPFSPFSPLPAGGPR